MSTNTNTNTPVANVNLPPCLRGLTSKDLRFKPLKVSQKTKKDGTQGDRKYGANFFQLRTGGKGGKWCEIAGLPIAAALLLKEYQGTFNTDTAAVALARLLHLLGIAAPAAVIEAADEAEARIAAKAAKKAAHEAEVVAQGKDAYKTAAADRADTAWARLVDRVNERAKQEQEQEQGEEA